MKKLLAITPLLFLSSCGLTTDDMPRLSIGVKTDFYEANYSSKGGLSVVVVTPSSK